MHRRNTVQAKPLQSTLRFHVVQMASGARRRRSTRKARRTAREEREGRVWRTPPSLGGGGGWETGSSRHSRERRPRRDRQSRRPPPSETACPQRVDARAVWQATDKNPHQRLCQAARADCRKRKGALRAFCLAKDATRRQASEFQRPPTSHPRTTNVPIVLLVSSG